MHDKAIMRAALKVVRRAIRKRFPPAGNSGVHGSGGCGISEKPQCLSQSVRFDPQG